MNDEPPVTDSNWLHHALVAFEHLSQVPAAILALGIGLFAGIVGGLWYTVVRTDVEAWIAGTGYALAALIDWVWLAQLPRRGLSFGPVRPPLLGLIVLRLPVALIPLLGCVAGLIPPGCMTIGVLLQVALSATVIYTTGVEPFCLGITTLEIHTPKLPPGRRVRLVQISDLHVERVTRRERDLTAKVQALDADFVLLTGDFMNFSYIGENRAVADTRTILGALPARYGTYAVRGTHQIDPNALLPVLFAGLPIRWLRSEHVTLEHDGFAITFAGASSTRVREIDVLAVERALHDIPQDTFTVLLYHTPERVAEAVAGGVDLYLAGHTHGGQLRLPFYGALLTGSDAGKQYEMGRYLIDGMTLYVSRGVGMEGKSAPRARFLCPPEIVCIDVIGKERVVRPL